MEGDARQILDQLIGYVIPNKADSKAIETHPIALRYFIQSDRAFLVSSQSNGEDEFQRPGNFFAHSIVGNLPEISEFTAPIFYWKSPFWVSRDNSDTIELPILSEFEPEIIFDFDLIWDFLDRGRRLEWFEKLLCAVIDYSQSIGESILLNEKSNEILKSYTNSLQAIKELVTDFQQTINTPLEIYLDLILAKRESEAIILFKSLEDIYSPSLLINQINQVGFLNKLALNLSEELQQISP